MLKSSRLVPPTTTNNVQDDVMYKNMFDYLFYTIRTVNEFAPIRTTAFTIVYKQHRIYSQRSFMSGILFNNNDHGAGQETLAVTQIRISLNKLPCVP